MSGLSVVGIDVEEKKQMIEKNTILIVEDNEEYLNKLIAQLEQSELKVQKIIHADNQEDAMKLYKKGKESLIGIITDFSFPLSKGREECPQGIPFIRYIREIEEDKDILIVLNSKKMTQGMSLAGKIKGANACISKDDSAEKVVAAIVDARRNQGKSSPCTGK